MATAIHKEIDKLKTADVTDEELAMYKTRARADLLRGLADNQGLANALAEYQTATATGANSSISWIGWTK